MKANGGAVITAESIPVHTGMQRRGKCARHLFSSIFTYGEMCGGLTLCAESAMTKEPGGFPRLRMPRFRNVKHATRQRCVCVRLA